MINIIFNTFKVKYSKLDHLIVNNCTDVNKKSRVNVFINLEPIFNKLLKTDIDEYMQVKGKEKLHEVISNIINIAAHYRLFFTKNKIYSRVYLYTGFPFNSKYENSMFIDHYRKSIKHKLTKDARYTTISAILTSAITFTQTILEYIDGVHLITSDFIEPSLIPSIIHENTENDFINFIVSSDKYEYQYVNKDGWYIIRPKQENSYIVTHNNLIGTIKWESKVLNDVKVGPNFYPFILSLTGNKYRDIIGIQGLGIAKTIKMIDKSIKQGLISSKADNINTLLKIIKDSYIPLVTTNHRVIDLRTQLISTSPRNKYDIIDSIINKFDPDSLKKINDEIMVGYPIYLTELTAANNLLSKSKTSINLW